MEKIKGFAIELDLDHLSVDRGLRGLKDNLKTVNSEMKHNMSAFDRSDRSVKKYETSLSGLNKKLEVQKVAVAEAKKEYEKMIEQHGRGSKEAEKAARDYNNQAASLNNLERYIERTKDELVKFEREQRIANSSFTKLGDKLESVGGKLKSAGTMMNDVGSKLTKSITLPAVGAATAVGGIVAAFGWGRLVALDNAQAKLKGLGYSMEDVERITLDVKEAVTGTTMTMAEGTSVAAGALAAGVKEGKELEKYVRRVGNAAIGANRPVEEMAMIFNRVEGAGKLMTQELNSIEAGMPGFSKALSKHLGVSTEKLRKMVTDGKVSSKDFAKVMDGFAGNMAKEYAKTWDGMVSNTKANIGIIGESFLRGVFQDSKKSLSDFIELLKSPDIKRKAEEMGRVAQESFGKMKDSIMGVVEWYQNLDDGQKTMIKRLGLIAIAAGPVLQVTGKLTSGLGTVLEVSGKLSKAIGVARGAGLAASLASLGPLAVGGIAVAGLAAISVGVYALYKQSEKAKEVNLDLAQSLSDEATELENTAEAFDKLSGKAKISNAELAELNDLNIKISKSSNPGEIKALQEQYDGLAKKSGLSKDELKALFEANSDIISQSPNVQQSVSDTGNAFVDNKDDINGAKDAIKEYAQSLRDLSEQELTGQRLLLLAEYDEANKNLDKYKDRIENIHELSEFIMKNSNMSKDDMIDRIKKIGDLLTDDTLSTKEILELEEERNHLQTLKHEGMAKSYESLIDEKEEIEKHNKKWQEKIDKLNEVEQQMVNIKLANVGITEEGEKGLEQLDKSIAKNDEELAKLDKKLEAGKKLSEEEQARYDTLSETAEKQREAKDAIFEEYGIYKDLNSLAQGKLEKTDAETQKKIESLAKSSEIKVEEGNIITQLEKKNSEYDKGIQKLEEQKRKEGANKKEIDNQISALEIKKSKNSEVIKKVLEELGVWKDLDKSIKDGINSEIKKGGAVDGTKGKLDLQGKAIDNNNKKTDAGVKKEQERTKEAGKDVDKNVKVKDNGTVAELDKKAKAPKNKDVNLKAKGVAEVNRQASSPVSKTINFIGKGLGKLKFWEKGTPPSGHPGGDFVAGEKGTELVKLPSGRTFLTPNTATFFPDMPKGTHVIPHQETKRITRNAPHYANGTDGWARSLGNSEFARLLTMNGQSESNIVVLGSNGNDDDGLLRSLLNATLKQNELIMQLLNKDNTAVVAFEPMYNLTKKRLAEDEYGRNKQRRR